QTDPTIIYALSRAGHYDGNLHKGDLSLDSPYNTYRYPGLPPGPIASPGSASLEAAVHPADASYLYFVSRNDGSHAFASTLDEHNRNVQKYQLQSFRNQRAGGAGGKRQTRCRADPVPASPPSLPRPFRPSRGPAYPPLLPASPFPPLQLLAQHREIAS